MHITVSTRHRNSVHGKVTNLQGCKVVTRVILDSNSNVPHSIHFPLANTSKALSPGRRGPTTNAYMQPIDVLRYFWSREI